MTDRSRGPAAAATKGRVPGVRGAAVVGMTDRSETSAAVVGCLAVVRRGEQVLLVQRAKPPGVGKWGFPGGHLEPGETASACAVRELREETAIAADPVEILTAFDFSADGPGAARQYRLIAVLCDWREGDGELLEDASALGWFTIQAAEQLDTFPDALAAMRLALGADRRHGAPGGSPVP